jgi:DNA-binding CsgD family transcriptional regulator
VVRGRQRPRLRTPALGRARRDRAAGGAAGNGAAIIDARLEAEVRRGSSRERAGRPTSSPCSGAKPSATLAAEWEAERTLEQARAEQRGRGARGPWRIEAALGHVHRAQRKRLEARRAFDTARAIAGRGGWWRRCRMRHCAPLHRRAGSPHPLGARAVGGDRVANEALGGLTQRGRDVAELIAQGRRIRYRARAGDRRADRRGYVASALGKLGFTSRTELATWAVEGESPSAGGESSVAPVPGSFRRGVTNPWGREPSRTRDSNLPVPNLKVRVLSTR